MRYQITFVLLLFSLYSCQEKSTKENEYPQPTVIKHGDEDGNRASREAWFDLLHTAAPEVNWKEIEAKNSIQTGQFKATYRASNSYRDEILIGDGFVQGEWFERGSRNQAGSVLITEYDINTSEIFAISAGGTLWKGTLEGNDWTVVNQDYRFDDHLLEFYYDEAGNRVWIASIGNALAYSEDQGATWNISDATYNNFDVIASTKYVDDILILGINRKIKRTQVLRTSDGGLSYESLLRIATEDGSITDMSHDKASDNIFLIEQVKSNESILYQYYPDSMKFQVVNDSCTLAFGNQGRANLQSYVKMDTLHLFAYKYDSKIYTSIDTGRTWNSVAQLSEYPWGVGIYASSYEPGNLLSGAVELLKSRDDGRSWVKVNNWWDYYNDVETKLHADMMYFEEYLDQDSLPFILISNHGGISKTYDLARNNENIGLLDLNVGQFYDVRTDPNDPNVIYGGTQDQGFQRGISPRGRIADLDQVISGDYGHIEFTGFGEHLWMVYPGGQVGYYDQARYSTNPTWYTIESNNESVWIPPIEPHPDEAENTVFLAGGNMNGGNGSHLLRLTFNAQSWSIDVTQSETDFREVHSEIAAIAFNRFQDSTCYVLTRNGVFYTSEDQGNTFERTNLQLPHAHYLYGNCIYTSKVDPNVIYISGSGYSNPGVYVSYDKGENFEPMSDGLPATTVFNVVGNPDETVLYAATEAGPYAYDFENEIWHYMGGADAPNTTFWSVEYVPQHDIVRFGTYGRGIWDFEVTSQPVSAIDFVQENDVKVYPNPTNDLVNIELEKPVKMIRVYNQSAQEVLSLDGEIRTLNMQDLPKGIYFISIYLENGDLVTKKVSKL